jgi:HEAT repeat protein
MGKKARLTALLVTMTICGLAIVVFVASRIYWAVPLLSGEGQYDGHPTSYWIDCLQDHDKAMRRKAIGNLGSIGDEAKSAVPALSQILMQDDDEELRAKAALALYKIGGKETVPALIVGLDDDFAWVRLNCALALAKAGSSAEGAVPALTAALDKPENRPVNLAFSLSVRQQSIQALGKIGPAAKDAVPPLIEALKDADVQTRSRAATALGCIGVGAMSAVPMLVTMLKDKDDMIKDLAAQALVKISPADAAKAGVKLND